ncbi:hypothetical protein BY458DRAFT_553677 [Sporodiniella umbellata]|nr:hypothetical protein BY458DRAFT_553677 [Sporodiniella umbellata]
MKYAVFFTIVAALMASCQAACSCTAEQAECLKSCVLTANQCVVRCQENKAGEQCEQNCLTENWPSMSVGFEKATQGMAIATSGTMATATLSKLPSSASTSLSATSSVPRPSTGASPTARPTGSDGNTSHAETDKTNWALFLMTLAAFSFF